MNLFIRIKNGQIFEHPILEENLKQIFPDIDLNNLPPDIVAFNRVPPPKLGAYEKNRTCQYEQGNDGVYRDVWYSEQMTDLEVKAKQDYVKTLWADELETTGLYSWGFDEDTCSFQPPVPMPDDGKEYVWKESTVSWIVMPPMPDDGKLYKFDIESENWILIVD
jgi:hypothetical protein